MNVREALNEIVANYGLEILRESLRTSSMVADYANGRNMLADRRLTKRALELGVADYLLDYGCDEAQKRRVVQMMARDGFEKVSAVYVVESLISTISSINTRIQISDVTVDGAIGLAGDYIAFDLANGTEEKFTSAPAGGWGDKYKTTHLLMRRIPKGTFTMGSPENELGRESDETAHQVTLTQDYYIGVFELTQAQYKLITGSSSQAEFGSGSDSLGEAQDKMRPMENVSYNDIRVTSLGTHWPANNQVDSSSVLGKLRAKFGNRLFDLPTEAQWEYACRAGTITALNSGNNLTSTTGTDPELDKVGWYWSNNTTNGETYGTKVVGRKAPNNWGLYDMHGNVWEWCLDWWDGDSYGSSAVTDPKGATSGSNRNLRGGGWGNFARDCRSARRNYSTPSYGNNRTSGLRLVLPIGQ